PVTGALSEDVRDIAIVSPEVPQDREAAAVARGESGGEALAQAEEAVAITQVVEEFRARDVGVVTGFVEQQAEAERGGRALREERGRIHVVARAVLYDANAMKRKAE